MKSVALQIGWIMTVSLWSVDRKGNPEKEIVNGLAGKLVSELRPLQDLDGSQGSFFIFPEVAVRREGKFRLLFTLVNIVK